MQENWSLSKLPPEGHQDVGMFFWEQYKISIEERERLNLHARWLENHRLWRSGAVNRGMHKKNAVVANLIFANVNRTVANLTAKQPSAEVISLDEAYLSDENGEVLLDEKGKPQKDDTDSKVTAHIQTWWNESEQELSLVDTCLNMEIYGPTFEKAVYNRPKKRADIVIVDPFAIVVPPGNYSDVNDMPYIGMAYPERPDAIETRFGLEAGSINTEDTYIVLGTEREDNRPTLSGSTANSSSLYGGATMHRRSGTNGSSETALIVELFVRDMSREVLAPAELDETGKEIAPEETGDLIYPGGIRLVTLTNDGSLVLRDRPNPNVNPALSREQQQNTYLFDHYPYWFATSYRDPSSIWGFAAAEQVGDLAEKISELITRMYKYVVRGMMPPLILPLDTGLTEDDVDNEAGLILTPISRESAHGIRFLDIPSLPADTIRLYDMMLGMFDRAYQIEDADRGDTPSRVIAASAIVALQERNAVLMKHKIRSVDYLIRQRGRAALSFLQNFGVLPETVKVGDDIDSITGVQLIDRKFKYVVESGSTIAQTSLQVQEQAMDLANNGHIDSQGLLEALNFPGWKEIVERMAENGGDLDKAAQAFIAAGIEPDVMNELLQLAMQPQGQPGGMM
jgi:hypothetical protein